MKNKTKKATTKSKKNENIIVTDDVSCCYTDPNASETECKAFFKTCLQNLSSRDIYSTFQYMETYFDLNTITSYNFVLLYNIILH